MAQNSDALQEPSMDELLASIREIIEENTGAPPPENGQMRQGSSPNPARQAESGGRYDAAMPNLRQDIFVRDEARPGRQPGQRPRERAFYGNPQPGAAAGDGGSYQNGREGGMAAAPQGQNGEAIMNGRAPNGVYPANNMGQSNNSRPQGQAQPMRAPEPAQEMARRPDPRAVPERPRPAQVQDSMNALAERIGLRRNFTAPQQNQNTPPAPPANPPIFSNNPAPQGRPPRAERPAAAMPAGGYMPQPGNNFAQANIPADRQAGGRNAAPSSPPGSDYGYNDGGRPPRPEENDGQAGARFNPAAAAGLYRQEREIAERERRLNSAAAPASAYDGEPAARIRVPEMPQPIRPQNADRSVAPDWPNPADMAAAADGAEAADAISAAATEAAGEMKRAFPSDVEHSTENLLRPFIARWLDEHFRDLFEKILREEVQRFIHSMHRDS